MMLLQGDFLYIQRTALERVPGARFLTGGSTFYKAVHYVNFTGNIFRICVCLSQLLVTICC